MSEAHPNSQRVVGAAGALGLTIDVAYFPQGTRTAEDAAAAIGCDVGAIVKSLVLIADGRPVLVLASGHNRVDYHKVGAVLGAEGVRRADANEAREATGYPIGGTPPFANEAEMAVLLDEDLLGHERVWAAAGTPDTVFGADPVELQRAAGATRADVRDTGG